jgi:hypothetical protein
LPDAVACGATARQRTNAHPRPLGVLLELEQHNSVLVQDHLSFVDLREHAQLSGAIDLEPEISEIVGVNESLNDHFPAARLPSAG